MASLSLSIATKGRVVTSSKSYATSGIIYVAGVAGTISVIDVDALIKRIGFTSTTSIDALAQQTVVETILLDALTKAKYTGTLDVDGILRRLGLYDSTVLDALLNITSIEVLTVLDSILELGYVPHVSLDIDSIIKGIGLSTQTLIDSVITAVERYGLLRFHSTEEADIYNEPRDHTLAGGHVTQDQRTVEDFGVDFTSREIDSFKSETKEEKAGFSSREVGDLEAPDVDIGEDTPSHVEESKRGKLKFKSKDKGVL